MMRLLQTTAGSLSTWLPVYLQVLEEVVASALQHLPQLLQVVDSLALLDMLLAFFHAVTG